jgi:hypothetical protein
MRIKNRKSIDKPSLIEKSAIDLNTAYAIVTIEFIQI